MKIFLVDPMSYSNLAEYDTLLLENIPCEDRTFFGNKKFSTSKSISYKTKLIYNYSDLSGIFKAISYLYSQIVLCFFVSSSRPNVIHFQWFKIPFLDYIFLNFIKFLSPKSKIIFTAHNILPHDSGNKYYIIFKKIYRFVDVIFVHDDNTNSSLITSFQIKDSKVRTIPHGLLGSRDPNRYITSKDSKVITFTLLGFLNSYKGIDLLLKAWENSQKLNTSENVRLVLAGKASPEIEVLLNSIRSIDNITVINKFLDDTTFEQLLSDSSVMLFPYKEISQSGVLLSSLAIHKPVLVSNVGGLTQPFLLGKVGWVLRELSPNAIREQLEYILDNNHELKTIQEDIRLWKSIAAYYDWENIGKLTLNNYLS